MSAGTALSAWAPAGFDDSSWGAAVVGTETGGNIPVVGTDHIWASADPQSFTEQVLFRQSFALPLGTITSAQLTISADDAYLVWLNGIFVHASPTGRNGGVQVTVPVNPAYLLSGQTNVIAVQGANYAPVSAWVSWKLEIA